MRKRIGSILTALMMVLTLIPQVSFAESSIIESGSKGSISWELNRDGVLTIKGSGRMINYDGPNSFNIDKVTSVIIEDGITSINGLKNYRNLASITIPNSVTSIASEAFENCHALQSITIPDSVSQIGNNAFKNCTGLTSIIIPEGVTALKYDTFNRCLSMSSVTLPDTLTKIGSSAFEGCESLTSVAIPDSVTDISESAFQGCASLTEITLPDRLTAISRSSFSSCSSLVSVDIPDSVTFIDYGAFANCISLTDIKIPEGITSIEQDTFSDCISLTEIYIPDSVTSIAGHSFSDCTSLKEINIPEGITTIEESTFEGCSSLTDVYIPDSVTTIDTCAFSDCTSLVEIKLPDSITKIGPSAFDGCTSLTTVNIPDNIVWLYEHTFDGCTSLVSIDLSNVQLIGAAAFEGCTSLSEVKLSDKLSCISNWAFRFCSNLTEIVIPPSLTQDITSDVFAECNNLTIYGELGSKAHKYAVKYEIPFSCISHGSVITLPEVAATCSGTGLTQGSKCEDCGYIITPQTKLGKLQHTAVTLPAKDATCTKSGKTAGSMCSVCGEIITAQKTVPATGHKYSAYKTTTKAGFGKKGIQTSQCQNAGCTSKKTKSIAALKSPVLSVATYTFNNKIRKPAVTVKNTAGTKVKYTASYASGRKDVGKNAVKVTVNTVNYKGTKTVYFKINPAKPANIKLTAGSKQFTVKWNKPSAIYKKQITGYEVRYATSASKLSSAKPVMIKNSAAVSKVLKGLKGKQKYYVQVRTYKNVKGVKYTSAWTGYKTVITK